jgi:alkylation response protein AidB-like acyl-CoA dehydrogenase
MCFRCSSTASSEISRPTRAREEITQIYEGTNQIQRLVMARALLND